jgi:hypothetical protein
LSLAVGFSVGALELELGGEDDLDVERELDPVELGRERGFDERELDPVELDRGCGGLFDLDLLHDFVSLQPSDMQFDLEQLACFVREQVSVSGDEGGDRLGPRWGVEGGEDTGLEGGENAMLGGGGAGLEAAVASAA